ncbi:polysaccharide deacetylase [Candidatus Aerophobetes bacterium]|uniref:Polysaccharide deacetylase n=1 Tax=Aerophobetes bacterium TaxID=2030807 RepID=A0A2A4X497_UNCAE|nr:MAG: polysaccharide deacetylase [Candidatus Aerophobetes bacterium]
MLFCLLYHKILPHINLHTPFANNLSLFEKHCEYIAKNYKTVHPNEKLTQKTNLCLTFDDATCDFFFFVYPLLKKWGLKATLAVPAAFPLKRCLEPLDKRLAYSEKLLFNHTVKNPSPAFCSWEELKQMADDPLIHIASHSFSHSANPKSLSVEIEESKALLEQTLNQPISTFIFPFGNYQIYPQSLVEKHYTTLFRIGNAANKDWSGIGGLVYRINADHLTSIQGPLTFKKKQIFKAYYFLKQCKRYKPIYKKALAPFI